MAVYFECRIYKNALLQTLFLAILPTGNSSENLPFSMDKNSSAHVDTIYRPYSEVEIPLQTS